MPIYRWYFNRCEDFPQIWSIDEGTIESEVNVIGVRVGCTAMITSGRAEDFSTVDSKREPKAWVTIDAARCVLDKGWAVFE
jgi:hypothetical protein